MTFPADFEQRIGFDRIRDFLRKHCISQLGQTLVDQMTLLTDPELITEKLRANQEFLNLIRSAVSWPSSGYFDPFEDFRLARIPGSVLRADAFVRVRQSLQTIRDWIEFLKTHRENYPFLYKSCGSVVVPAQIVSEINRIMEAEGRIKDNASPALLRVRRSIFSAEAEARRQIDRLFRDAVAQGFTPDGSVPVFREGRVAIPVKAEFKRRVRGVIVDESATGQTIFIEPETLVEINNEIRDLIYIERREELNILRDLTSRIRENISDLESAFHFLAWVDFNVAKARLSDVINGCLPDIKSGQILNWRSARHPGLILIKGYNSVVPMDMNLTADKRFLLISGPNAGGKSVCLKATGLLQYMVQCGLLPSADPDSEFGIYQSIWVDIGDQQSIENDLSTYSSHLRNMAAFISAAAPDSLMLIDEMGAGTDPAFGGGIAEAVLISLIKSGAWGIVTTHYANLKSLSGRISGICNAAMLFDSDRLAPLFRLEIGKPGSSYAMELSRKSGLPREIINEAEKIIGSDLVGLETLMRRTEQEKIATERLKLELSVKDSQLKEQMSRYEKLSDELESRKKEILTKARDEASALLRETNREIEKTIRHIRENKAEKKETKKVRQKLTELSDQVKPVTKEVAKVKKPFSTGDRVRIAGQDQSGVILELMGTKVMVQFGLLRSVIDMDRLIYADEESVQPASRIRGIDFAARRSSFTQTLDLRGRRAEDLLPELEAYIDNVILLGIPEVRIIHGKGEGVLRKLVREYLKSNHHVKAMKDEHADRGGAGITIVTMK